MDRINHYVEGRAFEWTLSCSMILLSIEVLGWSETLDAQLFSLLLILINTRTVGILLLVLGWAKFSGLMLNGYTVSSIQIGPWVRAVSSVISAVMWGQFTLILLRIMIECGKPSVILPFFFMFTIGELYVAYTTVKNAR
jgi:hypothetical protein